MQEHGAFDICIEGRTIVINATGAWNVETALSWGNEYQNLVRKLNRLPWACLVNLTEFELLVPEAWEHVKQISTWSNQNNQKYEAVVCSASYQEAMVEITQGLMTNVESKIFLNLQQARSWLHQNDMF